MGRGRITTPPDRLAFAVRTAAHSAPNPVRRRAWPSGAEHISARELEVLQLIANGRGNRQIAHELFLSEETIKTHVQRVLRKLQAESRAHAVAIALRNRLIV